MTTTLPSIDIRKDQTVGFSKVQYEQYSESVAQVHNAEKLRGELIGLAKTRTKNRIGLAELDGLEIGHQIALQKNQTATAQLSAEISRTSLALLEVDRLGVQGAITGVQIQQLTHQLTFEKGRLEQSQKRQQLELRAADIELKVLEIDTNAAKQLVGQKTKQTIDVPARRVA